MPSTKISDCIQPLQEAWPILRKLFKKRFPTWDMILTCTHRTPEEQFELFKKGREFRGGKWVVVDERGILTKKDGYKLISNHNKYPARAFDVALLDEKKRCEWDTKKEQWQSLPELARKVGLENGGAWRELIDFPHFQQPVKKT